MHVVYAVPCMHSCNIIVDGCSSIEVTQGRGKAFNDVWAGWGSAGLIDVSSTSIAVFVEKPESHSTYLPGAGLEALHYGVVYLLLFVQ